MPPAGSPQPYEMVIRGGSVVGTEGPVRRDVAISGGAVVALPEAGAGAEARTIIDATGKLVLPGLIDMHAHLRTPDRTEEDWHSGSRAAAAGGVTTVGAMPELPHLSAVEDLALRVSAAAGESLVDYLPYGAVRAGHPGALRELTSLARDGVRTVRLFEEDGRPGEPDPFPGLFEAAAGLGVRLLAQAADHEVLRLFRHWPERPHGPDRPEQWWPRAAGVVATARLVGLSRRYGTRLHLLGVSSGDEADLAAAAAAGDPGIGFEVSPHHLSLVADDVLRYGSRALLGPPAREAADRERLWAAVSRGAAVVASNHAPQRLSEKMRAAVPGVPGLQEMLPLIFTGLRLRCGLGVPEAATVVARVLAARPAGLLGIAGRKGAVRPGRDADLVIFDPDEVWALDSGGIRTKCGWSTYEGWRFNGRVRMTIRRGEIIYRCQSGIESFGPAQGLRL